MPKSEVYNCDCMTFMQGLKDNAFDLCIADPPYGIGEDGAKNHSRGRLAPPTMYTPKGWDNKSPDKVFLMNFSECHGIKSFGVRITLSKTSQGKMHHVGLCGIKKTGTMTLPIVS